MANTKLSISLIKQDVSIDSIVKEGTDRIELSETYTLFYKRNTPSNPKWVNTFLGDDAPHNDILKSKSISALIIYTVEVNPGTSRFFVVTFGYGKSLLRPNIVEERFGLVTTLNIIGANSLRSIDINSLESVPLNNRIQSSALSGIDNFNIDIERDLLKSVAGKAETNTFYGTLSGADSLSVSSNLKYNEIETFLRSCYEQYIKDDYRDNFAWINQMLIIKDQCLISDLNEQLLAKLNEVQPSKIWISIPEIIDWNRPDKFKLKSSEEYDDIDISILKSEIGGEFTIPRLKTDRLSLIDENGMKLKSWPLYKCIYADINLRDEQYFLNEGKWYLLSQNFVEQVNSFYNSTVVSSLNIIHDNYQLEATFNEKIAASNEASYYLMDQKLVPIGSSRIEFCDVYSRDKKLLHVKVYKGSAVLSHLFNQGLISAEALFDGEFRQEVNRISENNICLPTEGSIIASEYEIVYVIAKRDATPENLPDLLFFSKVAFRNVAKRLKRYGFNVSIKAVPYTYVSDSNNLHN